MKYEVTSRLLKTKEEGLCIHEMVQKNKGITSQNKQNTGKTENKTKEKIPNKKCIVEKLRPNKNIHFVICALTFGM